jgi:hypothetical protein
MFLLWDSRFMTEYSDEMKLLPGATVKSLPGGGGLVGGLQYAFSLAGLRAGQALPSLNLDLIFLYPTLSITLGFNVFITYAPQS